MLRKLVRRTDVVLCGILIIAASRVAAQQEKPAYRSGRGFESVTGEPPGPTIAGAPSRRDKPAGSLDVERTSQRSAPRQAELEAAFIEMLSGATLEGSFTSTADASDPTKLSREKYTLGEVKKIQSNFWLIPARIQYGEHDVTLPLTLPLRWAGDTPVIVVDNVRLPGFGTVSARVMFFADHYAGYWKHGKSGGHLFGVIRRGEKQAGDAGVAPENESRPLGGNPPRGEQKNKQAGQQ